MNTSEIFVGDRVYFFKIVIIFFFIFVFTTILGAWFGRLSIVSGASNVSGIAHSLGYITGIFFPMLMELKKEGKLDSFHKALLINFEVLIFFLTVYFIFFYFEWLA